MAQETYLYRCTEDKFDEHVNRIIEAGDTIEHVIFKGGRDYVLVCRKYAEPRVVTVKLDESSLAAIQACRNRLAEIADEINRGARNGAKRVGVDRVNRRPGS